MIKTIIWIVMIGLALIQSNKNIEFLLFEIVFYMGISFLVRKKNKKKKEKGKYKYQNVIEENIDYKKDEIDVNLDLFESQIEEIKNNLKEYENRVKNYDYREFEGKKEVPWEQIYDYLWLHCRYKGISMWIEYMNHLIEKGVMNKDDKIKIIKKAGDYIPWNQRIDMEAEDEDFKNEVRKSDIKHNAESERNMNVYKEMFRKGMISKEAYEDFLNRRYKPNLEYLKNFYYEDYLKEIGKI